jgi:speckle-type POZ protein
LSENRAESEIEVPPSDMMEHFGNLLKEKKGVDVTFRVGGKTFEAHKIVLAARSPVFKAEFFGPMRESGTCCVTVEDMHPEVFSAQLHFIYNDLLPDMGDLEGNDYHEMMWHLLVAADRYAMDRMKLVCQSIICKNLHLETVAATLALAVQHNCDRLKAACIEFIAFPNNKDAVAVTKVMRISKGCALLCSLIYLREKVSSHNRDE